MFSFFAETSVKMEINDISLQDLKDRYQLSQDQLDKELTEEHLKQVSIIIDDHEIVGPEMGLTEAEITAINCDGNTQDQRNLEMLKIWKRKYHWNATYRMLIEALLKCSRADHAQRVCELLAESKCYDITWSCGYYFDVITQFVITNNGKYGECLAWYDFK